MDVASLLANERRARLAAERLLEMRQRELKAANRKLADHARILGQQVIAKRDEMQSIQTQTENLRDEYVQTRDDLARAQTATEVAEGRLWSALQSVRDGFALFDADHRLILANKAYLSVFDGLECLAPGITYPEIAQILVDEGIIDPQGPPRDWVGAMVKRWHSDQPADVVLRLWNGQFVKLMDRRTPDGGTVTLGINQTEQLRMWAAVETVPDGFVLFDPEDRLIMCNAQYREMYDLPEAEVPYGTTFEQILRFSMGRGQIAAAVGREEQWLEERLNEHRRADSMIEQQLHDGRWLRILERATPDGGRVGLRVDITAIKEQQAALERERERAEAANRAKSAFLANMSHEIRTPMNGVVGMAEMLAGSGLNPEQTLYVQTIKSSGEALLAILNDILDFSKIEADRLELARAPFDLENCLNDVVRLLQPTVIGKPLRLSVAFDPSQPAIVMGDAGRVRQVLTNLIGNALKFTEAGEVSVQVSRGPEGVRIDVRDTGIGIPADKLDHIFGEFNQVEDDRNRRYDGTGLGLAICRQLVAQMGGRISVVSTLGKGSCFTVEVPLAAGEPPLSDTGVTRALVVGPKGVARDALAAQLAALGLNCKLSTGRLDGVKPTDAVFVLSPRGDTPRPPVKGAGPGAMILVSDSAHDGARSPDAFDRYLTQPVSQGDLARALAGLASGLSAPVAPDAANGRLRVLAAEDNKTNQLVLEKMLKDADIALKIVANGADALAEFQARPPDMVFMDISMPGMDGREAARRIRAFEAETGLPRTVIIAMTAHAMDTDKAEIKAAGIDHHLAKPLNRASLLAHIDSVRAARQSVG